MKSAATETEKEFEKMLAGDPANIEIYSVYADWLQERGDPRGDLLSFLIEHLIHGTNIMDKIRVFPHPEIASAIASLQTVTIDRGKELSIDGKIDFECEVNWKPLFFNEWFPEFAFVNSMEFGEPADYSYTKENFDKYVDCFKRIFDNYYFNLKKVAFLSEISQEVLDEFGKLCPNTIEEIEVANLETGIICSEWLNRFHDLKKLDLFCHVEDFIVYAICCNGNYELDELWINAEVTEELIDALWSSMGISAKKIYFRTGQNTVIDFTDDLKEIKEMYGCEIIIDA